ncbi:MAG TPA: TIR domain-containing protein [Caulobacteraceae bacterium]
MTDIFISYARSTEREARAIGEALRGMGYGVWRDDELPAHRAYADVIAERLALAKAVVVVWSAEAAKSEWVRSEAEKARSGRKLVQLRVDSADLPMPFDQIQCAELVGWAGEDQHPGWKKVTGSIAQLIAGDRPAMARKAPSAPQAQSVCVLPFVNMSGDPEQEYFSDGVSEDIITDLSKVSALYVAARNTAFAFKNKALPVSQLAREVGVRHVLEGSVRKAGNRVRITAQLIDGETGGHVWAERWDRNLDDIFALQDEISQAVVAALKVKLLPEEKKAIGTRGTDNVEAYNLYLMARRYYLSQSSKRSQLVARLCQSALSLDPQYARAWSLMATSKSSSYSTSSGSDSADGDGLTEAERALALDPTLAEAHAAKARVHMNRGNLSEARAAVASALALDPNAVEVNRIAGNAALADRRYADAVRYFEAASAADEQDGSSPFMALQCYEALGDKAGASAAARLAIDRLEKAVADEPDNSTLLGFGVGALVVLGETDRARDWSRHALAIGAEDSNLRYNLTCAMIRLGDLDYALDLLAEAFDMSRGGLAVWARNDSDLDPLRDNPRFQALMDRGEALLATRASEA